jgi:hypothetical protein
MSHNKKVILVIRVPSSVDIVASYQSVRSNYLRAWLQLRPKIFIREVKPTQTLILQRLPTGGLLLVNLCY